MEQAGELQIILFLLKEMNPLFKDFILVLKIKNISILRGDFCLSKVQLSLELFKLKRVRRCIES